eukprot:3498637-Pyramimonas_sp.AAC.1
MDLASPGGVREGVGRGDRQTPALGPDSLCRGLRLHSAELPLLDASALSEAAFSCELNIEDGPSALGATFDTVERAFSSRRQ